MEQVNSPWGLLPRGWRLSTIDEEKERLTDYVANGSFASLASNVHYKDTEDYAVLIRLVDFNNDFKGPFVYIDEHAYSFLSKSSLSGGEIIISNVGANVGTVFKCPNLPYKMSLAPNAITIKLKGDNDFYYYWFKSKIGQANIQALVTGSAQPKFNKTNFRSMYIPVPPLDVQRRIASILSSLDRKIELNNKINADLEEMAQAIFKNWFVDFEPFKDGKFVDSELGMIPEGWKVGTIGDIVEFQNGFAFSSKDFSENGEYKIITIKSVQDGCLVTDGSSKVTEYPTKMPAYCKLQSGDILLSLTGNVGRCCLVTETNLLLNQRVAKIKAKECYDNSFSYALFRLKETKELLISISRGTAQANLSPVEASKLPMVIPSEDARKSFSMISDSIMNKIISIHIENSRLSLLRDTLLPRLMSGEIEVPE